MARLKPTTREAGLAWHKACLRFNSLNKNFRDQIDDIYEPVRNNLVNTIGLPNDGDNYLHFARALEHACDAVEGKLVHDMQGAANEYDEILLAQEIMNE